MNSSLANDRKLRGFSSWTDVGDKWYPTLSFHRSSLVDASRRPSWEHCVLANVALEYAHPSTRIVRYKERTKLFSLAFKVEDGGRALFAGATSYCGRLGLVFYGPDAEGLRASVASTFTGPGIPVNVTAFHDPHWDWYEMTRSTRTIDLVGQVSSLEPLLNAAMARGVKLGEKREVRQVVEFKSPLDCERFRSAVSAYGHLRTALEPSNGHELSCAVAGVEEVEMDDLLVRANVIGTLALQHQGSVAAIEIQVSSGWPN